MFCEGNGTVCSSIPDVVVVRCRENVVICLSEHVRNDTLLERQHRITKPCRKQLKFELLQRVSRHFLAPQWDVRPTIPYQLRSCLQPVELMVSQMSVCLDFSMSSTFSNRYSYSLLAFLFCVPIRKKLQMRFQKFCFKNLWRIFKISIRGLFCRTA